MNIIDVYLKFTYDKKEKLKSFLTQNGIYTIDKLQNFSITHLSSFSGFKSVKSEIIKLKNCTNPADKDSTLTKKDFSSVKQNQSNISNQYFDNTRINKEISLNKKYSTNKKQSLFDKKITNIHLLLSMHIFETNINVRTSNVLTHIANKLNKTLTVKDLLTFDVSYLLKQKNLGQRSINDINELLYEYDLRLGMSEEEINFLMIKDSKDKDEYDMILSQKKASNLFYYDLDNSIIKIPTHLFDISINDIYKFISYKAFNMNYGSIKRISSSFNTLGDLHNLTPKSILKKKSLGKRSFHLLMDHFFKFFHFDKYEDIVKKFIYYKDYNCSKIDVSPHLRKFLKSNKIFHIKDISCLDELVKTYNFSKIEILCLLELRTLHVVEENFLTNSNIKAEKINYIKYIDKFLSNYIKPIRLEYLMHTFNEFNTLESTGKKFNITRERVRQIVVKETSNFKLFFVYDEKELLEHFFNIIKSNLKPIRFKDVNSNKYEQLYSESMYVGFLNRLLTYCPFEGYNYKIYDKYHEFYKFIKEGIKKPNQLELNELLKNQKNIQDKFLIFHIIFTSQFHISRERKIIKNKTGAINLNFVGNKIYINRDKYPVKSLVYYFLDKEDRPLLISDFAQLINASGFINKKYETINSGRNPLYAIIGGHCRLIKIDKYLFGRERHLSYLKSEWPDIISNCVQIIKDTNHQVSASFLFNKIKIKFKKFKTKYELVHIIKQSDKIVDLGFYNFSIEELGIKERIMVKDALETVLINNKAPMHHKDIVKEISKIRTLRSEGLFQMAGTWGYSKYKGGYIGLPNESKNLDFLFHDNEAFIRVLSGLSPHTDIINISKYFNISTQQILERVNNFEELKIVKDNTNTDHIYIINTNHGIRKKIKCIVLNNSNPLTVTEIIWDLYENLTNKEVMKYIKLDKNYNIINNKIEYCNINEISSEIFEVMEEIEEYLYSITKTMDLNELYIMAKEMTNEPLSKNQFITFLERNENLLIDEDTVGII